MRRCRCLRRHWQVCKNIVDAVQSVASIVDVNRSGSSVTSSLAPPLRLCHEMGARPWGEAREWTR